jgi:hypothetical protein
MSRRTNATPEFNAKKRLHLVEAPSPKERIGASPDDTGTTPFTEGSYDGIASPKEAESVPLTEVGYCEFNHGELFGWTWIHEKSSKCVDWLVHGIVTPIKKGSTTR